jgi:uncharacterized protein
MNTKLPKNVKVIITETSEELRKIYSGKVKGMILFGSYARGDQSRGSDIDIALLLDKPDAIIMEREKFFETICRISLKYDTVVSVIPIDYKKYKMKQNPLFINIANEGIKI